MDFFKSLNETQKIVGIVVIISVLVIIIFNVISSPEQKQTENITENRSKIILPKTKNQILEQIQKRNTITAQRELNQSRYSINKNDTSFIKSIDNQKDNPKNNEIKKKKDTDINTNTTIDTKQITTEIKKPVRIIRNQQKRKTINKAKPKKQIDDIILFSSLKSNPENEEQKPSIISDKKTEKGIEKIILKAAVYNTQTVGNGDRVKIIIKEDFISKDNAKKISGGKIIYTTAAIGGGRVYFNFNKILYDNGEAINKQLNAYDVLDDRQGIYAEELLEQQATKEVIDENILDPTTTTGKVGNTIGNFLKKSSQQVKIELRDNTEFIIK